MKTDNSHPARFLHHSAQDIPITTVDGRAHGTADAPSAGAAPIATSVGSDGPLNPFLNIMFATIHANNPFEALSREEAVLTYTHG